jgi:hypothetical protein
MVVGDKAYNSKEIRALLQSLQDASGYREQENAKVVRRLSVVTCG